MAQFQEGDIIMRPYDSGGARYRQVRDVTENNYIMSHGRRTIELAVATGDDQLSVGFIEQHYTLVDRPGVTPGEEVKQMTKFNVGDIIRYETDYSATRLVLEIHSDFATYRISGYLSEPNPLSAAYWETTNYVDNSYNLVVAAQGTPVVTDAHKADMATLSTKLAAEARRRGWCSEYEGVITGWNADLTIPLDPYPSETVRTNVTLSVTMTRTDEVTSGETAADFAYNLAYTPNSSNFPVPHGWEVTGVRTSDYSHEVIAS